MLLKLHNVNPTMLIADLMGCSLHDFNKNLWKVFNKYDIPTDMRCEENFKFSEEIVNKVHDRDERKKIGDKVKALREFSLPLLMPLILFRKAWESYTKYDSEILMLVPVATNTSHWKEYVFGKANGICFLSDTRLKFMVNGNTNNKGCPMACCLIYYGKNVDKFKELFYDYGAVVSL